MTKRSAVDDDDDDANDGRYFPVTSVNVQAASFIGQIKFNYSDGNSRVFGPEAQGMPMTYDLEAGEYIVAVHRRMGEGTLDAVKFETNKGSTSPWYGNKYGGTLAPPLGLSQHGMQSFLVDPKINGGVTADASCCACTIS